MEEAEERKRKGDTQEPKASKYFMRNKADIVYHHCRSEALHKVGIEEELFDNNDPESINASIKKWENYGAVEGPSNCALLFSLESAA